MKVPFFAYNLRRMTLLGENGPVGLDFDHTDLSLADEAGCIKQAEHSLSFKMLLLLGAAC